MNSIIEKEKKIEVLHLNSEKSWRGGEQQLAYLLDELQLKNVRNYIICREGSALERYCIDHHVQYTSLPFRSGISLRSAQAIKNTCRKLKIDLVHIHSGKPHTLAVLSTLLGNHVPMVLSRRIAFPISNSFFSRWKFNSYAIKKIICISAAVEQEVMRSINRKERCTIVHSGIDINRFSKPTGYLRRHYSIAPNEMIIGNVAALSDSKDLLTFLATAAIFRQYNIPNRFVIIGEGEERRVIQKFIAENKLENQVLLTGFLKNVDEILPEFDAFLTTAKVEGLGTSVLDAFASKVPVVATRAGGIPEMVIHEKTGLLAEVKDAEQLALHLKRLVDEPALKEKLTNNAYQHLMTHFTKEKMASDTLAIYREVLNNETR